MIKYRETSKNSKTLDQVEMKAPATKTLGTHLVHLTGHIEVTAPLQAIDHLCSPERLRLSRQCSFLRPATRVCRHQMVPSTTQGHLSHRRPRPRRHPWRWPLRLHRISFNPNNSHRAHKINRYKKVHKLHVFFSYRAQSSGLLWQLQLESESCEVFY